MKKQHIFLLVAVILSFASASLLKQYAQWETPLADVQNNMEAYVRDISAEIIPVLNDFDGTSLNLPRPTPWLNWYLYESEKLIYWTDKELLPPDPDLAATLTGLPQLLETKNGSSLIYSKALSKNGKPLLLIASLTLYHKFPLDSPYLPDKLILDSKELAPLVQISSQPGAHPVLDAKGRVLFYLHATSTPAFPNLYYGVFLLYLIAYFLLIRLTNSMVTQFDGHFNPWLTTLGVLFVAFLIRESMLLNLVGVFQDMPLFSDRQKAAYLGKLLADNLLLLWLAIYFHQQNHPLPSIQSKSVFRLALSLGTYVLIITTLLLFSYMLKKLVTDPGLDFDFDHIFAINGTSLLAVFGILLALFSLFLFSHRLLLASNTRDLPFRQKIMTLSGAMLMGIPIAMQWFEAREFWPILGIALIYLGLFELFMDTSTPGLSWLVIWLAFFSGFTAIVLYRFNLQKDADKWLSYAPVLANPEDAMAEAALQQLGDKLMRDSTILGYFNTPVPFTIDAEILDQAIDPYFMEENYLSSNYEYSLFLINLPFRESLIRKREANPAWELSSGALPSNPVQKYPDVSRLVQFRSNMTLFWKKILPTPGNPNSRNEVYLTLSPRLKDHNRLYREIFRDIPFKGLTDLEKFDFALYNENAEILKKGVTNAALREKAIPLSAGEHLIVAGNDRKDLIYKGQDGKVVVIGKAYGGGRTWLSLFSFLFILLLLFLSGLLSLDRLTPILPASLYIDNFLQPSLRTRIQASILSLILVSFVIIAFVTIAFFRNSSLSYLEDKIQSNLNAVLSDIRYKAVFEADSINWTGLIRPMASIHGMDINVYDSEGKLAASSAGYVFSKGIQAALMNPHALESLRKDPGLLRIQSEKIGQLSYQTAYASLLIPRAGTFYLGLPFYSRNNALRTDIYQFMGTLMSTYVFLLLIAGALGLFVTNSITHPLARIGEKLKGLELGAQNEVLEWNTNDELGELIRQYNLMVRQLDESAQKLKQSEREGAWREMARQVAHEIKNPLTPMKLSIQHLLYVQRNDPEKAEALLPRVSNTLIEQIDSLSRIATEFSNFAQMPKAENQYFNLNELVQKAFDLFAQNQSENLNIELFLPEAEYPVYADKEHLLRVLNNLITNAIQAMPEDRKGKISIRLSENDGILTLEIEDNGKGIPEETREKVFSPYFTTKSSGTGLGLAISKNVIEAMAGKIYFQSTEGMGTSFFIKLPLADKD